MNKILDFVEVVKSRVLTVVGLIYGLGLIHWMIYSFLNNITFINAFEAQYFVTGIIPCLLVFVSIWLFTEFLVLQNKCVAWITMHKKLLVTMKYTSSIIIVLFYTALFTKQPLTVSLPDYITGIPEIIKALILFAFLLPVLLVYPAFNETESEFKINQNQSPFKQTLYSVINLLKAYKIFFLSLFRILLYIYLIILLLLFSFYYFNDLYPNIPQELGGVRPKKAVFIIDARYFSDRDQTLIFNEDENIGKKMTDTLLIYFQNSDKILFKPALEMRGKRVQETFEISRSNIESIKWID